MADGREHDGLAILHQATAGGLLGQISGFDIRAYPTRFVFSTRIFKARSYLCAFRLRPSMSRKRADDGAADAARYRSTAGVERLTQSVAESNQRPDRLAPKAAARDTARSAESPSVGLRTLAARQPAGDTHHPPARRRPSRHQTICGYRDDE